MKDLHHYNNLNPMVRKSLISWVVPELVSRRMMCRPFFGGTTAG